MDPLTISSAFATLVGLVVNFRQERGAQEALTHRDFVEWLETHRHNDIRRLVVERSDLQIAVDNVLRAEHQQMLQQLDRISSMLVALVSHVDGFRSLSQAAGITSGLSEQAVAVLRGLVNSTSREFGIVPLRGASLLSLTNGGSISVSDQRFLPDDLNTLVAWGMLTPRIGSNGTQFYGVTRSAAKFIATIDSKAG